MEIMYCPSTDEKINNGILFSLTKELISDIRYNKTNLENMLYKKGQISHNFTQELSRIDNFKEQKEELSLPGASDRDNCKLLLNGYRVCLE